MTENTRSRKSVSNMLGSFLGIFGSRVAGLARDLAMTHYWGGSGAEQAAFHVAFSIPNLFRNLFGEGAFTAAFLPAVAGKLEKDGKESAWRLAERVISLQIIALAVIVALMSLISGGIYLFMRCSDVRPHILLTFKIIPLLMPYALLICVAGSFASILNSLRVFALPAINPVIFNVVQIASIALLYFTFGNTEPAALYLFCGSVLLAGVLQALSLGIACRRHGFVFHFRPIWRDEEVKQVLRKFLPGTVGAGVNQINQLIDKWMVNWLGPLAVSGIEFSHRLIYLPVGLFGVAISSVCLTDMSRAATRNDSAELSESLDRALRMTLFLSIPCAVLLGVLAEPFVRMLFRHGAFNDDAVRSCVTALMFYIPGIPAFCCAKVALTPHHANLDTATPVRISIACVILNFILNISLIWTLKQGGLALSTSICSWANVCALLILARKYLPEWKPANTVLHGIYIVIISCIAGSCAFIAMRFIPFPDNLGITLDSAVRVMTGGLIGATVYFIVSLAAKRPELMDILAAVRRR